MMSNLIKSLVYENVRYTFLFRKVNTPGTRKYFVTAFDKVENKQSFEVKLGSDQKWHIVPPAPDWVAVFERQLYEILEDEG